MAQTTTTTTDGKSPVSTLATAQAEGAGMITAFNTAMMQAMARYGTEFTEFVSKRLQEDMKTQHEILGCRDIGKLGDIQATFVKTAMDQYSAETGKLLQMSNEIMDEAFKRAKS
ncbi:phasin family protein [Actibacterium lipolyticum]|uniref:Phasin protein n=1 Tax=Actibacterium lipolyticum TaxID=1524263 RepID=A0A238JUL2_9RHOB|nr:phasin family protein [Actibacterium lipolyticum]SMX34341.1 Phasin protein [Actibacterium lipolyticum]